MLNIVRKIIVDLCKWLVGRLKYILLYFHACWATRSDLYKRKKYQTFIFIFCVVSVFGLWFYYWVSDNNIINISTFFDCSLIDTVCSYFRELCKLVEGILGRWFLFIGKGSNLAVVYGAFISLYCFLFSQQKEIVSSSTTISDWYVIPLMLFLAVPNLLDLCDYKISVSCLGSLYYNTFLLLNFWIGAWFLFHITHTISRINVINLFEYLLNCYFIFHNAILLAFGLQITAHRKCWEKLIANSYCQMKIFNVFLQSIVSINQILVYFVRNDLIGIYCDKYQQWKCYSFFLNYSKSEGTDDKATVTFIEKYFEKYDVFYEKTLKCQHVLIRSLYEKGFITEGYAAVQDLFEMQPYSYYTTCLGKERVITLYRKFLLIVLETALYFYNNSISLMPTLKNIKWSILPENFDDVISMYRVLMIKATENRDVKTVILLSYDVLQTMDKVFSSEKELFNRNTPVIKKEDKERYKGRILYIFICAAIKSIELGNKEIVSFMVKFIVSEFNTKTLSDVLSNIKHNLPVDTKYDTHDISNATGINSFHINNKTCNYCFEKLVIMLYGQQLFIKQKDVAFNEKVSDVFSIEGFITGNQSYIFEKLCLDGYNLLWMKNGFNNIKFREKLKSELSLFYGIQEHSWQDDIISEF